jgi:HSP20 family protein
MFLRRQQAPLSSSLVPSIFGFSNPHVYVYQPHDHGDHDSTKLVTTNNEPADAKPATNDAPVVYRSGNVHVEETKDKYTLSLDLPGVKEHDLKIDVDDGVLQVSADRKQGEKTIAKFVQRFVIDETSVDTNKIDAKLSDGVLTLTVSKKEEQPPVVVEVNTSEAFEDKDEENVMYLTADVPGVKLADIKIEYFKGDLTIRGVRKNRKGEVVSRLNRVFAIAEKAVDTSSFKAFLVDGVLTISFSRKNPNPPKTITHAASSETDVKAKKDNEIIVETATEDDD